MWSPDLGPPIASAASGAPPIAAPDSRRAGMEHAPPSAVSKGRDLLKGFQREKTPEKLLARHSPLLYSDEAAARSPDDASSTALLAGCADGSAAARRRKTHR